jgi:hypothetical protein
LSGIGIGIKSSVHTPQAARCFFGACRRRRIHVTLLP